MTLSEIKSYINAMPADKLAEMNTNVNGITTLKDGTIMFITEPDETNEIPLTLAAFKKMLEMTPTGVTNIKRAKMIFNGNVHKPVLMFEIIGETNSYTVEKLLAEIQSLGDTVIGEAKTNIFFINILDNGMITPKIIINRPDMNAEYQVCNIKR